MGRHGVGFVHGLLHFLQHLHRNHQTDWLAGVNRIQHPFSSIVSSNGTSSPALTYIMLYFSVELSLLHAETKAASSKSHAECAPNFSYQSALLTAIWSVIRSKTTWKDYMLGAIMLLPKETRLTVRSTPNPQQLGHNYYFSPNTLLAYFSRGGIKRNGKLPGQLMQ